MDEDENSKEKDGFGLDKDQRLMGRRERQTEENMPELLDPPFSFRVVSFDPILVRRQELD